MSSDRDARSRVAADAASDRATSGRAPSRAPLAQGTVAAPRRWTSATLTAGVVGSAACFLIAGAAELLGVETGAGEMTDVSALAGGLADLTPWAWASVGTLVVVLTPALGLLATACEYASVSDRRTVLLALAVLAVLGASAILAIVR